MLYACAICRRPLWRRALCDSCSENLWTRREPSFRAEAGFGIYSLFTWERDGWRGLRWWIHALKEKEDRAFWHEPAVWALDTFASLSPAPSNTFASLSPAPSNTFASLSPAPLWVPIPSRRARHHARGLARALCELAGGELLDVLAPTESETHQRHLSRQDRQRRHFAPVRGARNICRPVVLVDDVVTTGATLRAAFRALGRPKACQAWCLMDRRPCGRPGALL